MDMWRYLAYIGGTSLFKSKSDQIVDNRPKKVDFNRHRNLNSESPQIVPFKRNTEIMYFYKSEEMIIVF